MEQTAQVSRVADGKVWLKATVASGCHNCSQQSGCGTSALSQALPQRELVVDCDLPLQIGDQVKIEIAETHLLQATFIVYGIPLLLTLLVSMGLSFFPVFAAWLPEITLGTLLGSFGLIHWLQGKGVLMPRLQVWVSGRCL